MFKKKWWSLWGFLGCLYFLFLAALNDVGTTPEPIEPWGINMPFRVVGFVTAMWVAGYISRMCYELDKDI